MQITRSRTKVRLLLDSNIRFQISQCSLLSTSAGSTGSQDAKKKQAPKVPQPPYEQVEKALRDKVAYQRQLHELRANLVKEGVHLQSKERARQKNIEESEIRTASKETNEDREKKIEKARQSILENSKTLQANANENKLKRITQNLIRRKYKEIKDQEDLEKKIYELAQDIESVWEKEVALDMNIVMPVNAPFLGVLPKRHSSEAWVFADKAERLPYLYGPPLPTNLDLDPTLGFDPRIAEYLPYSEEFAMITEEASSSRASPDTTEVSTDTSGDKVSGETVNAPRRESAKSTDSAVTSNSNAEAPNRLAAPRGSQKPSEEKPGRKRESRDKKQ